MEADWWLALAEQLSRLGQRIDPHVVKHTAAAIIELFPQLSCLGISINDAGLCMQRRITAQASPRGLCKAVCFNCGWETGGLKTTPDSARV